MGANWVDKLPWVLLGIRTMLKEDTSCSIAEFVYVSSLTVLGDFICSTNEPPNPSLLLSWLRQAISKFNFIPMSQHDVAPQHKYRELLLALMCLFDVIRTDHHLHHPMRDRIRSCNTEPSLFRLMLAAEKKLFLWIVSSLRLSRRHFRSNSVIPRDEEDHQSHNIAFV